MSPRVIAIGDAHGCATALRTLLEAVRPGADDTIVVLGDCIDRGPDSRGVMEQLMELRERCRLVPLMGNHEEMMLNFLDGRPQPDDWLLCGGEATLSSYDATDDPTRVPSQHVEFIRSWDDYWQTDTHFFAHGGYHPEHPLAEQRWRVWRWHSLRDMVPGPHISGKTAVVGHTSQKSGEILDFGYLVCVDTYCWGGGWLTALDTTSGRLWQTNDRGQLRS